MRIAFDCLGTLKGRNGNAIAEAFRKLQALGHECVVWSSDYSMTIEMKKHFELECETMAKRAKYEMRDTEQGLFDVAVDDDRQQTYLGAKQFVWVDEMTRNPDSIVALILQRATEPRSEDE